MRIYFYYHIYNLIFFRVVGCLFTLLMHRWWWLSFHGGNLWVCHCGCFWSFREIQTRVSADSEYGGEVFAWRFCLFALGLVLNILSLGKGSY